MQFIFSFSYSSDNFHSRFPFIVGPPLAPDMRWLPTSVRPSVVRPVRESTVSGQLFYRNGDVLVSSCFFPF